MSKRADTSSNNATKSGRNYSGLSQAQRKANRRQQFLEAGLELAGSIGFRATTVRALCKEAKLTDRYFYESFGNMETLVTSVYEDCMTGMIREVLEAIQSAYIEDGVFKAIETGLDTYYKILEDPRTARICMIELEGINPDVDQLYNNYIRNIGKIFVALTDKAFPDWDVETAEKEVIAMSLIGVLRQTATNWLLDDYDKERRVLVAGTLKVFMGTINQIK